MNETRVRFAPSPTGNLHMGNVRVAIFNWLFARHNKGKYLVRIEDTDLQRSTKEFLESQLNSLKWLDLLSDEPIIYQSSRLAEHKKIIQKLIGEKLAYPCFCDPIDFETKRAELLQLNSKKEVFICQCRDKDYKTLDLQKPHAIRFKIPDSVKEVKFDDAIRGEIKIERNQLDDFVIMRRDGIPTYNFVVVVDDIFMRITNVIRGEDHISNTPKQILIYNALNVQSPVFAHLPLILGPNGTRLSKRDAAVNVDEYRKQGFLADAFFNYLVRLGWSHGDQEIFTKKEMIKYFNLDDVGKKGSIFDIKKLEWLNGVYIRQSSFEELFAAVNDLNEDYKQKLTEDWNIAQLQKLFEQYKQRATKLLDMVQDIISLAQKPKVLDLDLISKWLSEKTFKLLQDFVINIEKLEKINHEKLIEVAKSICKKYDQKLVAIAQPLRLAITGKIVSPGIFELICILNKKDAIERIRLLIEKLKSI
ncbi:glutamate--tRNA ligase [Candidatus Dependentiae bacterium]|nr:glutamate--tRNA ligase [Candidatus Dependentiae bacterium]